MAGDEDTTGTRLIERPEGAALLLRRAELEVLRGPDAGRRVPLERTAIRVGSDPDNDLVVADPTVSGRHFEIVAGEHGRRLRDLGSTNGTTVDGLRALDVFLRDGSEIGAGSCRLRFTLGRDELSIPLSRRTDFGSLLGHSPAMRAVFAVLERAAKTDALVLIAGESGTGKELAARALHDHSPRRAGPYIVFDCGAAAPNLVESQLFGHAKGAYTGAADARAGVCEAAHGGTLVLDELGELPLELQPKLLRVLESRTVQRLGETSTCPVDVRFVASTNRNLEQDVRDGRFRQDLFYRVSVITVRLPALRERPEEIPRLVRHFLERLAGPEAAAPPPATLDILLHHSWPGNVRELRNFVERYALLPEIDPVVHLRGAGPPAPEPPGGAAAPAIPLDLPFHEAKERWTDSFERTYLARLLEAHERNVSAAARAAGLSRQTMYRLMEKHGLRGE
ncbi:MAG: sigma 54-dependent Fis family transcriptional regulator [Acidobacteria bacterium]|nr:sigma 54-dependent Fis family transcriptional regulator [Acidobacteriota bacterium]